MFTVRGQNDQERTAFRLDTAATALGKAIELADGARMQVTVEDHKTGLTFTLSEFSDRPGLKGALTRHLARLSARSDVPKRLVKRGSAIEVARRLREFREGKLREVEDRLAKHQASLPAADSHKARVRTAAINHCLRQIEDLRRKIAGDVHILQSDGELMRLPDRKEPTDR